MTKLPHPSWEVKGVEGPKYKVGPRCAVATCERWADHAHHIWRRSFLAGDYRWVKMPSGRVLQNIAALCWQCHEKVTVGKSWIEYDDEQFFYVEGDTVDVLKVVLVPQPKELRSYENALQLTLDGKEVPHNDVVGEKEEPSCPTCGHKKGRKKKSVDGESLPKRNRAAWSVTVPKDERENGADVLDELILGCAEKLDRADHSSYKYYTLAEVLASFLLGNIEVERFTHGA